MTTSGAGGVEAAAAEASSEITRCRAVASGRPYEGSVNMCQSVGEGSSKQGMYYGDIMLPILIPPRRAEAAEKRASGTAESAFFTGSASVRKFKIQKHRAERKLPPPEIHNSPAVKPSGAPWPPHQRAP